MPDLHSMKLPPPRDWQAFERITLDAMSLKWASPNLQLNGRPGQAQHGVDIYGSDYLGRPVGIQCKHYAGPLRLDTVNAEIGNAENFIGKLTALFLATTASQDAVLQKQVRVISEERTARDKFAVGLLFWDDIFSGLTLDRKVLSNHYPQLNIPSGDLPAARTSALASVVVGYYGTFLWSFIELVFGEFGWMAQEDPNQVQTMLIMIRRNLEALPLADMEEVFGRLSEIDKEIFESRTTAVNWDKVKYIAQSVENRVRYLPDLLVGKPEARFVELGIQLGRVYHADGKFDARMAERIYKRIVALVPEAMPRLVELLERLNGKECYNAGSALYSLVDGELRWPA
jgi:hypothetical protein